MELPVTILGVGTGYGYSTEGPTHHVTQDISIMRALPDMTVWSPSDYVMVGALVHQAYESGRPSYIRADKGPFAPLYDPDDYEFSAGLATVRAGADLTIVATGIMVTQALGVAEELEAAGISVGIVDFYRLKPPNIALFLSIVENSGCIVTLEEHTLYGGLGSMVCEILVDYGVSIPTKRIGIDDKYRLAVGDRDWLRSLDRLDVPGIAKTILEWLGTGSSMPWRSREHGSENS